MTGKKIYAKKQKKKFTGEFKTNIMIHVETETIYVI